MTSTSDIVQKLWNLCTVLWHGGVTYHQYVNELTYLLFLKMVEETDREDQLPEGYRWSDIVARDGLEQLEFYKILLIHLGSHGSERVQAIYADASTAIREPKQLATIVKALDGLDWYSAKEEGLGDLYEGLLEKNATEQKRGAGQYFTPRTLIDSIVDVMKPQPGERVQDPAAGTGGFLIVADRYIKGQTDELFDLKPKLQRFQRTEAFAGVELVPDARRLGLMNLLLHGIESDLALGDTLGPTGANLAPTDLILTNPPFGSKRGSGGATRDDFTFPTNNRQLAFLQHCYRGLKPGGRCAIVVPDNVLFEESTGTKIRTDLMDKCDLHTILRLPTGIFYAQGVKTNVLFFTRGENDKGSTKAVWIYDLRTNMPSFGKRTPLTRQHFAEFEKAFGKDPNGKSRRKDQGEEGRFRKFSRQELSKRGESLDINWLASEDDEGNSPLAGPDVIAAEILSQLKTAAEEMEALSDLLERSE